MLLHNSHFAQIVGTMIQHLQPKMWHSYLQKHVPKANDDHLVDIRFFGTFSFVGEGGGGVVVIKDYQINN